jgi:hypothetical protein
MDRLIFHKRGPVKSVSLNGMQSLCMRQLSSLLHVMPFWLAVNDLEFRNSGSFLLNYKLFPFVIFSHKSRLGDRKAI